MSLCRSSISVPGAGNALPHSALKPRKAQKQCGFQAICTYRLGIKDKNLIDPPYNTGNDFIYEDNFSQSASDYAKDSGQTDEDGNLLVQNSESNGRFHTDWLILKGISKSRFDMYVKKPEEFISKVSRLINEEKATMIVDGITYNKTDGTYDSEIFTAERNKDFIKAYHAKKNVQDYVFAYGTAERSIERKFAEEMDLDDKVIVYAKLPRGFQIPTPVGNYAPDWAI